MHIGRMWWAAAAGVAVTLAGGCAGDSSTSKAAGDASSPSPSVAASCSPSYSLSTQAGEIRGRTTIESDTDGAVLTIAPGEGLCIDDVAQAQVPVYWTPFKYEPPKKGFSFTGVATATGKPTLVGKYDGTTAFQLKFPKFKDKCTGAVVHLTPEPNVREVSALSPKSGHYVLSEYDLGTLLAVDSRGSENCIEITVTQDK